jgi:Na+/citrate or Na+/malate symporter
VPSTVERQQAKLDQMPLGLFLFFNLMPIVASIAWTRQAKWLGPGFAVAMVPGVVANLARRFSEPDPGWTGPMRATTVVLLLALLLGALVIFGRKYAELERVLFTEATSVAFFATLFVAGGYAALERQAGLPRVSFAWIPVIGLAVWGATVVVLGRRFR